MDKIFYFLGTVHNQTYLQVLLSLQLNVTFSAAPSTDLCSKAWKYKYNVSVSYYNPPNY
jgi:hypothetical protein